MEIQFIHGPRELEESVYGEGDGRNFRGSLGKDSNNWALPILASELFFLLL